MSGLGELALPVPELVDVVPVEQADALIAVARQELAELTHEVESARLAADSVERQVASRGGDLALVGRTAEQVQRFIEERRTATDQDLKELLDLAADQAKARIEDARAEADRITADARRLAAGLPDPKVVDASAATVRPPIFPQLVVADDAPDTELRDEAGPWDVTAAAPAATVDPPRQRAEAPGPSEPLWLPTPPAAAAAAAPPAPVAPAAPPAPVAEPVIAPVIEPATATVAAPLAHPTRPKVEDAWQPPWGVPATPAVAEPVEGDARDQLPSPPVAASTPTAVPAPASAPRLGSVPLFALLQVVGLVVVLVALLVFVN